MSLTGLSNFLPPGDGRTAVVGMSGGVDSSVSAAILRDRGYRVVGLFMKNWEEDETLPDAQCTAAADYEDVARVCERLGIDYYSMNFAREYWDNVFQQFVRDYERGLTPNPDILCNREIKFKVFFDQAMKMGADFLATGHYCQNFAPTSPTRAGRRALVKGVDANKDQTYFLYAIDGARLDRVLFPVGHLPKPEVRALAARYDLATKEKKDSTGICFIGERRFQEFLARYVHGKPGKLKTLTGETVGQHRGVAYYTIGQRKGLGLGGQGEPWFVVGKDIERNLVFVERGTDHPALYASELWATEPDWIAGHAPPVLPFRCRAKIRYRQPDQDCVIESIDPSTGRLHVRFDRPQRAITPRQAVVFYQGDECLGGAWIEKSGPSLSEEPATQGTQTS